MRQHIIAGAVGAAASLLASFGYDALVRQPAAPAQISAARAKHNAAVVWPELSQAQVDALTVELKKLGEGRPLMIFCADDSRCGDIALNIDNAAETAHWKSEVKRSGALPPGFNVSSRELAEAFTQATGGMLRPNVDPDPAAGGGTDFIAIGDRQ